MHHLIKVVGLALCISCIVCPYHPYIVYQLSDRWYAFDVISTLFSQVFTYFHICATILMGSK